MKKLLLFAFLLLAQTLPADTIPPRLQWFADAKLGIFIHWGIYAVDGIDESWSFYNGMISHEDYMKQLDGFTAAKYDPGFWAKTIRESGAKYAVLTSKHHDGVALWDTKMGDRLSVVARSPARRDVLTPFFSALKKEGLKVGCYFSLLDWSHPDYPGFIGGKPRYEKDSARFERFLTFMNGQLDELARLENPDLWWFDGDWEHSAQEWHAPQIRQKLLDFNPKTVINSRLAGSGDYATPECSLPLKRPDGPAWELCLTLNENWGYQPTDHRYKSAGQVIQIFANCISKGGNLLLDIAPRADGTFPDEQLEVLKKLGRWTQKHAEAIYGTSPGLAPGLFDGPSTYSKNGEKLFLFLPKGHYGEIMVRGLERKVNRAYVVGGGQKLQTEVYLKPYWQSAPGVLFIDLPQKLVDEEMTVICLMLGK